MEQTLHGHFFLVPKIQFKLYGAGEVNSIYFDPCKNRLKRRCKHTEMDVKVTKWWYVSKGIRFIWKYCAR